MNVQPIAKNVSIYLSWDAPNVWAASLEPGSQRAVISTKGCRCAADSSTKGRLPFLPTGGLSELENTFLRRIWVLAYRIW